MAGSSCLAAAVLVAVADLCQTLLAGLVLLAAAGSYLLLPLASSQGYAVAHILAPACLQCMKKLSHAGWVQLGCWCIAEPVIAVNSDEATTTLTSPAGLLFRVYAGFAELGCTGVPVAGRLLPKPRCWRL